MSTPYQLEEERIDCALRAWPERNYASLAALARAFRVDPHKLRRRASGAPSKSTRSAINKLLTNEQEAALVQYIIQCDKLGVAADVKHVRGAAEYLLAQASPTDSPPPKLGAHWSKRFMERNPQFFKRKQKPLAVERKDAHDPELIQEYFDRYKELKIQRGIIDQDTYNMNETGFRIGCGRAHYVFSLNKHKPQLLTDADTRDYITSIECISAGEWDIPPMLIVAGKRILHKWALKNDLDGDVLFAASDIGYFNDELAFEWLKHFDLHIKGKTIEA